MAEMTKQDALKLMETASWSPDTSAVLAAIIENSSLLDDEPVAQAKDPGEGWRILDTGEQILKGDEFWNEYEPQGWRMATLTTCKVQPGSFYRRANLKERLTT